MNKFFKKLPDIILAEFKDPAALVHAAEKMNAAGYNDYDCHSPFPIHGMDKAMGLKRSKVGYIVAAFGSVGMIGSMYFMYWTSAIDYPLLISGKPYFSWQAFIPVSFALTILLSAFGAVLGMLALNKLPKLYHQLFNSEQFARFSDDKFFVSVEATDPNYNEQETIKFLESIGGSNLEVIKES